jgi:hypothetical protein
VAVGSVWTGMNVWLATVCRAAQAGDLPEVQRLVEGQDSMTMRRTLASRP